MGRSPFKNTPARRALQLWWLRGWRCALFGVLKGCLRRRELPKPRGHPAGPSSSFALRHVPLGQV